MAVISIIGCAGVGKSTLVRQLAALNRAPAFFEGEEGVFPEVVTSNLITEDPVGRERWFVGQYMASLQCAHAISTLGTNSFVDNASPITIRSYAAISPNAHTQELQDLIVQLEVTPADLTVVLVAKPEILAAYIAQRGRVSEEVVSIAEQAVRVQENFIQLAAEYGALVIDRTGMDFHSEHDLQQIDARIKAALSPAPVGIQSVENTLL